MRSVLNVRDGSETATSLYCLSRLVEVAKRLLEPTLLAEHVDVRGHRLLDLRAGLGVVATLPREQFLNAVFGALNFRFEHAIGVRRHRAAVGRGGILPAGLADLDLELVVGGLPLAVLAGRDLGLAHLLAGRVTPGALPEDDEPGRALPPRRFAPWTDAQARTHRRRKGRR